LIYPRLAVKARLLAAIVSMGHAGSCPMMRSYRLLVALLLQAWTLLLPLPAVAAPRHMAAELVASSAGAPGGDVQLALHFRPDPGWHGYWLNPGDAGVGMALTWNVPQGARIQPPHYPVPETLLISGLMNHVYEHDYAVIQSFTIPQDARQDAELPVSVKAEWLACTVEICVPESAELHTVVKVHARHLSEAAPPPDSRFDSWNRRLPAPLAAPAHFVIVGETLRLAIGLPANQPLSDPHFFVATDHVVDYAAAQRFLRKGDWLIIVLRRAKFGAVVPPVLGGTLRFNKAGDGVSFAALPGAVPMGGSPLAMGNAASRLPGLSILLLGALLGGLLLNVMPCVFPILSLKALSLARAGESEADAHREGLAYTAGVVLACAALGALLLALRAGGQEVGWAFQLQEPLVVASLMLLATALTANFLGLFEFAVPGFARAGSAKGAFATGLLAAFVATPCTGPFMAAAMGAALLLPVAPALALFAALGLGIALPFLAIAFLPALRRRMPRPGGWMVTFRRWMALPMGLTACALLWLGYRLGGAVFALMWLGIAVAVVAALVLIGTRQRRGLAAGRVIFIGIVALVIAGALATPHVLSQPAAAERGILAARPYSETALANARASGKPVFLYFTADWCLTCKVNEQVAIEREETRRAFAKAGVQVLVGDWTRRDPVITRFLTARGVAGVPLYLWFAPGAGEAEQLPQVLTLGMLLERANQRP
jgi:DsbC/DsbD-like thiol-disulfide interchange protein/cytochrome c biogenesis protein CcdA